MPEREPSVQERYAPRNACFGCGPANPSGLRIRSFPSAKGDGALEAQWRPEKLHEAFPGVLNGGIIGALLDCHANWTAACHFLKARGGDRPPCTVTAEFSVKLKRPTPTDGPVNLWAMVVESAGDRALVSAELRAGGKLRAVCRGTFIAVGPGHPAYHRW